MARDGGADQLGHRRRSGGVCNRTGLRRRSQCDPVAGGGRVVDEGAEDVDEGLCGDVGEDVGHLFAVVGHRDRDRVSYGDHHRERVVRRFDDLDVAEGEISRGMRCRTHVLDDDEGVEEFGDARDAMCLGQGQMVVFQYLGLDGGQAVGDAQCVIARRPADPHRHRVDQKSHHAIDAVDAPRRRSAAAGHHGSERHVVGAGEATDGDTPCGVQQRTHRDRGPPCGRGEGGTCPHPTGASAEPVRVCRTQRTGAVGRGDPGGLGHACEHTGPGGVVGVLVTPLEPVDELLELGCRTVEVRSCVGGQQVVEHDRHRPSVGDDVVHRLDHGVPAVGAADEGVAGQRRAGEVEPAVAFPIGALRDDGAMVVICCLYHVEIGGHGVGLHGHRRAVRQRRECSRQRSVPVDHGLGRALEAVEVQGALDVDDLLHHIGIPGAAERRMEVDALLGGGHREDIDQFRVAGFELGDIGGIERHAGEVRRTVTPHVGAARNGGQEFGPASRQTGNLCFGNGTGGPAERRTQHGAGAGVDRLGVDLEQSGQRHQGIAVLQDGEPIAGEGPGALSGIESAEIVEEHLWVDGERLNAAEVSQCPVTEPVRRHCPQLVLDRAHRRAELVVAGYGLPPVEVTGGQRHRVQRGEPAHGRRHVDVADVVALAAVALQLHEQGVGVIAVLGTPLAQRQVQRRDHRIVDMAVNPFRYRGEHRLGDLRR